MGTNSTPQILEGAKKALDNANKFTHSVTGGKPSAFAPQPERSDYSHAREARKNPDEFLGVRSDEAPEIKSALDKREATKKALDQ